MVGINQDSTVPLPIMADCAKAWSPQASVIDGQPGDGEILAWGMSIFDGIKPLAYSSHRKLAIQLARDYPGRNLWPLNIVERMPYPFAIFHAIDCMFATEKQIGRRADWFLWLDDDVVVPPDCVAKLRAVADPIERPFVAGVGYDRNWPHKPAVWVEKSSGECTWMERMKDVPESGVHKVHYTGLTVALFHRSLFDDRVSEPWFAVMPPIHSPSSHGGHLNGMNPDIWWCEQMGRAGIAPYICCDFPVYHLGAPMAAGPNTSAIMRDLNRAGREEPA